MYEGTVNFENTVIIFFPFSLKNIRQCYLIFDLETFDKHVKIFFVTKLLYKPNICVGLFSQTTWDGNENRLKHMKNYLCIDIKEDVLTLKKLSINGVVEDFINYHVIWINYDFTLFSQCEISTVDTYGAYNDKSYFKYFKERINEKVNNEKRKKTSRFSRVAAMLLGLLSVFVLKLSRYNLKQLPITKYFNVALHIDNYLNGFVWAVKSVTVKKQLSIKVINLLLSVFLDMLLGILFLRWLNSNISLDSFPSLFLFTTESIVNSIKDLINWLRGDPAGLKLNGAFNKVLATFYSFHIEIWWTFIGPLSLYIGDNTSVYYFMKELPIWPIIQFLALTNILLIFFVAAYLKPLVKIIFQVFLKLGLLGLTFQASITADLLALVSFHVYCIYAYAARLYSIQISTLISLWRLFLGRKKNPLRGKVDSCRYTPEQLFVGTLGFTILLFLLPTTLLYYIVFTCIRLSILTVQAILMLIRCLNQCLPVYTTILWLMRSPKVCVGIEIIPYKESLKSDFILLTVKPVIYSWWETVNYFMPDCVPEQGKFKLSDLLSSLISGKLIFPI